MCVTVKHFVVFQYIELVLYHLRGHRPGEAVLQAFDRRRNATLRPNAAIYALVEDVTASKSMAT